MSILEFIPSIVERLDFIAASAYLIKYNIVTIAENDNLSKSLQVGSATNSDVVRKLLSKIDQNPRQFYRALRESVTNQQQNPHYGNLELFKLLPQNFGKGLLRQIRDRVLRTKRPKTPTFATIKEDPVSSSDVDKYDAETESSEEDEPDLHFGRQHELPRPTSTMSLYHDNHARRSPSPGGRSRTISQNSLPVNLSDERISRKYMELSLQPYEIPMIAQYFNRQVLSRSNSESINIALINLQKEKDKLQNEKTTLLEDKVKLLEDKTKLVEDLSKLQQENAAFQKLYKELNVQQQELSNRNDELVNAIEQVKAQLRDSQCLNIEKENALTDSEERNITLLQDNDDLQVSVKEFEVKYLQLSTSFDQVKKQLEDTKQKLTHAYTNKKIEELEASLKESQNKLEKANEDCVAMMQAKEVEQLKLHEKLEATQMTVSDLKQRNEELQKFLEISQNDLEKTKEKDEFNKQSMADELDNLKHSNTTIQGLLETTQKELEKTKDNAESNKQSMSHEIDELKHSNATIKGLLETTQKDLNETTLQGKIKQQSMSDEIEELKQSNVKLQDRANVPKVTSGLHSQSKGKSLAPASFNIHVTVRRLDALKQSQKENELKIQKQFVEINSVKSENAKLEKQCSEYQKKISYLTVQLQTEKQRKTYHREPQEEEIEIQSAVKKYHEHQLKDLEYFKQFEGRVEQFESQVDNLKHQLDIIKA